MAYIGIDIGSSGVKGLMLDESGIMTTHKHEGLASGSETAEEVAGKLDGRTQDVRDAIRVARLTPQLGVSRAIELLLKGSR